MTHSVSWLLTWSGLWMSASSTFSRHVTLSSSWSRGSFSRRGAQPFATRFLKWMLAAWRIASSACGATATCIRPTT